MEFGMEIGYDAHSMEIALAAVKHRARVARKHRHEAGIDHHTGPIFDGTERWRVGFERYTRTAGQDWKPLDRSSTPQRDYRGFRMDFLTEVVIDWFVKAPDQPLMAIRAAVYFDPTDELSDSRNWVIVGWWD